MIFSIPNIPEQYVNELEGGVPLWVVSKDAFNYELSWEYISPYHVKAWSLFQVGGKTGVSLFKILSEPFWIRSGYQIPIIPWTSDMAVVQHSLKDWALVPAWWKTWKKELVHAFTALKVDPKTRNIYLYLLNHFSPKRHTVDESVRSMITAILPWIWELWDEEVQFALDRVNALHTTTLEEAIVKLQEALNRYPAWKKLIEEKIRSVLPSWDFEKLDLHTNLFLHTYESFHDAAWREWIEELWYEHLKPSNTTPFAYWVTLHDLHTDVKRILRMWVQIPKLRAYFAAEFDPNWTRNPQFLDHSESEEARKLNEIRAPLQKHIDHAASSVYWLLWRHTPPESSSKLHTVPLREEKIDSHLMALYAAQVLQGQLLLQRK